MNDRMIGKLPKLDFSLLKKTGNKSNLNKESFMREPNYDVIKAFVRKEPKKQRAWKSTGDSLYYYNSEVARYDGEDIILSDAGWQSRTTNIIITGLLQVLSDRLGEMYYLQPISGTVTIGSNNSDERYLWTGSLRIKPTPEENKELVDQQNNPLKTTDTKSLQKQYRYKRKGIRQDAIKLKEAMEQHGWNVDLSTILNENIYSNIEGEDLYNLFYEYIEGKGYRKPEYIIGGILKEYTNVQIKNITPKENTKFLVEFNANGTHKAIVMDIQPNVTTDDLKNQIESIKKVDRDGDLPSFLTWLMER